MEPETYTYNQMPSTPMGRLWIAVGPRGLVMVGWEAAEGTFLRQLERLLKDAGRAFSIQRDDASTAQAVQEMEEYLLGQRQQFTVPVDWDILPDFQRQALKATYEIPFGQTSTYGEIASQIGHPGAARAVGRAEATNPLPLILPCHRVVGSDGKLHGYGGPGGLEMKRWLLDLERK